MAPQKPLVSMFVCRESCQGTVAMVTLANWFRALTYIVLGGHCTQRMLRLAAHNSWTMQRDGRVAGGVQLLRITLSVFYFLLLSVAAAGRSQGVSPVGYSTLPRLCATYMRKKL